VVKVKDGYARNFLCRRAWPTRDEANKKKIAYEAQRHRQQRAAEKGAAETEAARIASPPQLRGEGGGKDKAVRLGDRERRAAQA